MQQRQDEVELIKNALLELPMAQRMLCMALRHIQLQITEIQKKKSQEIFNTHKKFNAKYKVIEDKISSIVQGSPISVKDLAKSGHLITEAQKAAKAEFQSKGEKIANYWRDAIANSDLAEAMKDADKQIARFVEAISRDTTQEYIELKITFSNNTYFKAGTFTRRLYLENGFPTKFTGDQVNWATKQREGIFERLLSDTEDQALLQEVFYVINEIHSNIVPYSLQYYLGALDELSEDELDIDDDDQQEQDDDDQQNQ